MTQLTQKTVLVAMSGGVDSSVAAYLLKRDGYRVEGISLQLWQAQDRTDYTVCCSVDSITLAARTAQMLGIRHHVLDVRGLFIEHVIEPFIQAYKDGKTPNPCILCNRHVKFPILMQQACALGIEFIATGHYASVRHGMLQKGIDPKKDQSYFLYMLTQDELDKTLFPLGCLTKDEVRDRANGLGLPAAQRAESQEICFVEHKNYQRFIRDYDNHCERCGTITDTQGKIIGKHQGIYAYTIGQRRGLRVATGNPIYVITLDNTTNTIIAGPKEYAFRKTIVLTHLNWNRCGKGVWMRIKDCQPMQIHVKFRSTMKEQPALISLDSADADYLRVSFEQAQWAPAPGQSAVLYDRNIILGGGIISGGIIK